MIACGLDFGTSNSAIGVLKGNAPALAPVEGESTLIPSAVFFEEHDRYNVRGFHEAAGSGRYPLPQRRFPPSFVRMSYQELAGERNSSGGRLGG
jgi:hypothetical chaperone protein